jgi:chaperonin GroES
MFNAVPARYKDTQTPGLAIERRPPSSRRQRGVAMEPGMVHLRGARGMNTGTVPGDFYRCRERWSGAVARATRLPADVDAGMDPSQEATTHSVKRRPVIVPATKTKFRPLHDRVLVKRIEEEEARYGDIIIPDTAKEKPQQGKVIAVGTGKRTDEGKTLALEVKAGNRVLFGKYSGSEVRIDDEDYLILREEDILGVLD